MPNTPPGGPDSDLLGRYLTGDCSEAETAVVRRYLMTHPDAARVLQQYVQHLDGEDSRPQAPDAAASVAGLRRRVRAADEEAGVRERDHAAVAAQRHHTANYRTPATIHPRNRIVTAAIMVATAAAAAVAVMTYDGMQSRETPVQHTYVTAQRQQADLSLSDGTRVHIAPGSRLRVAADFGGERRDIYLEGEAYFEVTHDERRPFTVYAGNASAHDLGTAFSVRSYADDKAVEVVVSKGAVAFSGVGRLDAGDVARLGRKGEASVRRHVNVAALLGWLNGDLVFTDAPLGQVLQDLRRWYGVDVNLADPTFAALPFTGTLNNLSSGSAIDLVAATLGLRAVRSPDGHIQLDAIAGRTPGISTRHHAPHSRAVTIP